MINTHTLTLCTVNKATRWLSYGVWISANRARYCIIVTEFHSRSPFYSGKWFTYLFWRYWANQHCTGSSKTGKHEKEKVSINIHDSILHKISSYRSDWHVCVFQCHDMFLGSVINAANRPRLDFMAIAVPNSIWRRRRANLKWHITSEKSININMFPPQSSPR